MCTLHLLLLVLLNQKDGMGRTCNMNWGDEKCIQIFFLVNLKG